MTSVIRKLTVNKRSFPLAKVFRISRGAKSEAKVIEVTIEQDGIVARAESVPTPHYNETQESVIAQITSIKNEIENGRTRQQLQPLLTPGAARNAIDCALWDLQAKIQQTSVAQLANLPSFNGCKTAQTISLGSLENMQAAAEKLNQYPLIKVKFDNHNVVQKMRAIAGATPNSHFIVDANEAWNLQQLNEYSEALIDCRIDIIEQPLSADGDEDLIDYHGKIPLCADESLHTSNDLDKIAKLYQTINIKLDKTGDLTEAIKLFKLAKQQDLKIMMGCMVGSSLAMAPAALLASNADWVDLDGPALMATDREIGFSYHQGQMGALNPNLWGN